MKPFSKLDERVLKTYDQLVNGFLLCMQKQINVKVKDICNLAKRTRITYYHHFDSKQDLGKFAVKYQLTGSLPIPRKLKPINFRHLLKYFCDVTVKFAKQNKKIIAAAIWNLENGRYQNSYADLVTKTLTYLVFDELTSICPTLNHFSASMWSEILTGMITKLVVFSYKNNFNFNAEDAWNSIKSLISIGK